MNPLLNAAIVRSQSAEIALAADRHRHVELPARTDAVRRGIAWPRLALRLGRRPAAQTG
jgi:hypothetical protein